MVPLLFSDNSTHKNFNAVLFITPSNYHHKNSHFLVTSTTKNIRPTERNAFSERLEWKMCIFIRFVRGAQIYFFSCVFFLLNIVFTFVLKSVPKKKENKEFMLCTRKKVNTFLNKITKLCTKEWSERQRMGTFLCLHTCCDPDTISFILLHNKNFLHTIFFLISFLLKRYFCSGMIQQKLTGIIRKSKEWK